MNNTRIAAGLLVLTMAANGFAQTAQQYYDDGINNLTGTNLDAANLDFSNAVVLAPTNPTNNFFYALTSLATLGDQPVGSAFLSNLGFPMSGRNLYDWKSAPLDAKGRLIIPVGVSAGDFSSQLRTNVLPALMGAESNLAAITGSRFSVELTPDETHLAGVTVDYGDVLMMESVLEAAEFSAYEVYSWNLNAQLTDISTILNEESAQALAAAYPSAFTTTTTNDFAAARTAFTNSINFYLAASQFIRQDRPPGVVRLFNLSPQDEQKEFEFRETLSNIETSLSGPPPVTLTANPNYAVSASVLFNPTNSGPRAWFPQFQDNEFVWGTFPDVTLGGLAGGLTQQNLAHAVRKYVTATLDAPGANLTIYYDSTNPIPPNALAENTDGNLYEAIPYTSSNSIFGGLGDGAIGQITPDGDFTNFYVFGSVTDFDDDPLDGAIPNALIARGDGYLYGTTESGGPTTFGSFTNVVISTYYGTTNRQTFRNLPPPGTVFKLSTNGNLTTLFTFTGAKNSVTNYYEYGGKPRAASLFTNGASPSGVFTLGKDGNFYGTTTGGAEYGYGAIFKITTSGVMTNVYQVASGEDTAISLAVSSNGIIYAAEPLGGFGFGAIVQINSGGQVIAGYPFGTLTDDFGNPLDGWYPDALIVGPDGNVYGAAEYGGTNGEGTVFQFTPSGNFSVLYSFDQSHTNGANPVGALAQDANGVLYGAASAGGENATGTIYSLTTNGVVSTIAWLDWDTGHSPAAGLVAGMDGNIYGTTSAGGRWDDGALFGLFTDSLQVSPAAGFAASGPFNGPFSPASAAFVVTNSGPASVIWLAGSSVPWLTLTATGGLLAPAHSAGTTVNLNESAANLDFGSAFGVVWFTNTADGVVQSRQFSITAGNPGFESGNFTGWTLGGDNSYTLVSSALDSPEYVHSGSFAALLGTSTGPGTLSVSVPTVPGETYDISFWLDNPVGGEPSEFEALWGGQTLFSAADVGQFGWTNMQFTAAATGNSTVLQFTYEQNYDYFGLDDILVTAVGSSPYPLIESTALSGQNFSFSWSTTATSTYQVQYATNLSPAVWQNLGAVLTASGSTLSTNDQATNTHRYYRVVRTGGGS
jgi:uncharacterized repeat protein (TIGR03803 family)